MSWLANVSRNYDRASEILGHFPLTCTNTQTYPLPLHAESFDEDPDHLLRVSYSKLDGLVICFQKGCGSSHFEGLRRLSFPGPDASEMFPYHYLLAVQWVWSQYFDTSYFGAQWRLLVIIYSAPCHCSLSSF